MRKFITLGLLCATCLTLTACPDDNSAESKQKVKTQELLIEADNQLGMPAIINFAEKRAAKDMLELRDKTVPTFSYITSMSGCLVFLGNSLGFGLPYSTQYTNPQQLKRVGTDGITSYPQAEPNGLYMPEQAAATWVMLYDTKTKTISPTYVEQDVLVSMQRLTNIECK